MKPEDNDNDGKKTPAWLLERLAQGELDPARADQVRARLQAEGRSVGAELEALERSNDELRAALPGNIVVPAIRRRAAAAAGGRRAGVRWNMVVAPLALAGALGLVLVARRGDHAPAPAGGPAANDTGADESTRIKGDVARAPRLYVYRKRPAADGDGAERLASGARAARGDLLQLAYASAEQGLFGVLLSIDGAGRVTLHLPEEGARTAQALRSAREMKLPSSYQLDDAPGFERFILITAPEPFAVETALGAARALAADGPAARQRSLALPSPRFHQTSVLLDKVARETP